MSRQLSIILWILVGFSVVFVLLALLGSPSLEGKPQQISSDLVAITSAISFYRKTIGHYPSTEQGLMALVTRPETLPEERDWQSIAIKIPTDPWKNEYHYRRLAGEPDARFELRSLGPDGIYGTADDRVSE